MGKTGNGSLDKIFDRVLKDIKPSDSEIADITYRVNELMGALASIVPKDVTLRVAGSMARGTNLKGTADVDIFMLFDKKMDREKAVKQGLEYGKALLKGRKGKFEIKYAEHPYLRLYLDSLGIKADIVPAFKIDDVSQMGTTVDRTPLHTEFINSNLSKRQRDEVRLLKYLLKAHGIYGAEVKTNGFSGYLCELMIHNYGSLMGFLQAASKFKLPVLIEPKSKRESDGSMASKRFNSQFVVIDPVDSDRNVAAGVSLESLGRLVIIAREFVQKPDIKLFYGHGFSDSNARKIVSNLSKEAGLDTFLIVSRVPDKSEDVIYPQLRKVSGQILRHLEQNGFNAYFVTQFISEREGIIFMAAPKQQIRSRMVRGPSAFIQGATAAFMKKHSKSLGFVMNGTDLYSLEKTDVATVEETLRNLPKAVLVHKDINLRNAKIFVNKVDPDYAILLYAELQRKIFI